MSTFKVFIFVVIIVFLQVSGPLFYRALPKFDFIFLWVSYTTMGLFSILFFYTVLADVGSFSLQRFSKKEVDLSRRSFLGAGFLSIASTGVGVVEATKGPKIFNVDVPIKDLPRDLEGFKIAQVSDLHVGPTISKAYAEQVVALTNALQPDLIALTGDLLDGYVEQLKDKISPLSQLKAKHGVLYVTGNHEYYWGIDSWLREMTHLGADILINEHRVVVGEERPLVFVGIPDKHGYRELMDHKIDLEKALLNIPENSVTILLSHRPDIYQEAADRKFDLVLSGHTHGGQFFPWNMAVALVHKYYIGLNRHENTWIYVNRGTGFWGPPLRLGVSCEITSLRLVRA